MSRLKEQHPATPKKLLETYDKIPSRRGHATPLGSNGFTFWDSPLSSKAKYKDDENKGHFHISKVQFYINLKNTISLTIQMSWDLTIQVKKELQQPKR